MIQNAFTGEPKAKPIPKPKTVAQRQSDYTVEGAPPAGNAAQTLPIAPVGLASPPQPAAARPGASR